MFGAVFFTDIVGQSEQKYVMLVVTGAEQDVGFPDHSLKVFEQRGGQIQTLLAVVGSADRDGDGAVVEGESAEMHSREQWGIDQSGKRCDGN